MVSPMTLRDVEEVAEDLRRGWEPSREKVEQLLDTVRRQAAVVKLAALQQVTMTPGGNGKLNPACVKQYSALGAALTKTPIDFFNV